MLQGQGSFPVPFGFRAREGTLRIALPRVGSRHGGTFPTRGDAILRNVKPVIPGVLVAVGNWFNILRIALPRVSYVSVRCVSSGRILPDTQTLFISGRNCLII